MKKVVMRGPITRLRSDLGIGGDGASADMDDCLVSDYRQEQQQNTIGRYR
jgi:hypothetical protein